MLIPKKTKYRKAQKGRIKNLASSGNDISFGRYGLKALGASRLTSRQIEAARRAMTRYIKRGGKVWIRVFPSIPVTCKPAEVPMGSGKGSVDHYVVRVAPGKIIFELDGVDKEVAKEAMRLASNKLPFQTKFLVKSVSGEKEDESQ